jgi:hypothetical protein
VAYEDGGQVRQLPSRGVYHPARHARGEPVEVLVQPDGSAYIDDEWEDLRAAAMRDYRQAHAFPWLMGWMVVGVGAFVVLLALGVIFWVDDAGTA